MIINNHFIIKKCLGVSVSWILQYLHVQNPLDVQIVSDLQLLSPQGDTKRLSKMGRERIQLVTLKISQDIPVNTLIYVKMAIAFS